MKKNKRFKRKVVYPVRVQNKWSLAAAVLFILLGISLIIWPLDATTFIYNTLGVLILVYGSTKIIG